MHREDEYKHLAKSTRQRGCEEQNALLRAQWEILAATSMTPARIAIPRGIAPERKGQGTKRTCRVALQMSAFGGKADVVLAARREPLAPGLWGVVLR